MGNESSSTHTGQEDPQKTPQKHGGEGGSCGIFGNFLFAADDPLGVHRNDYLHSPARQRGRRRRRYSR